MKQEDVFTQKVEQRKAARSLLLAVDPEARTSASERAAKAVMELGAWEKAELVLAFLSMKAEIDTGTVIEAALAAKKRVAVPRIRDGDIEFIVLEHGWRQWPRDRWDIPEPPAALSPVLVAEMAMTATLALVPGLAFDRKGGRLGRGKGYYDRFLTSLYAERDRLGTVAAPLAAVGLGYAFQLVDRVPTDERDKSLDGLALG